MTTTGPRHRVPADVLRNIARERRRRRVRRVTRTLGRWWAAVPRRAVVTLVLVLAWVGSVVGMAYDHLVRDVHLGGWVIVLVAATVGILLVAEDAEIRRRR